MKTITQKLYRKKDCKHSVVFEPRLSPDEDAITSGVYINRGMLIHNPNVEVIELTLKVLDKGESLPA
jgi:hypothetical protein